MAQQNQVTYSNREYYEMIRCYFLSGESLYGAQRIYASESLPRFQRQGINSRLPTRQTILSATQRLLEFGQFRTPSYGKERGQTSLKSSRYSSDTRPTGTQPEVQSDSSSDESPLKKPKTTKGRRKKLSMTKKSAESDTVKPAKKDKLKEIENNKEDKKKSKKNNSAEETEKGVKRSRSQRSLEDVDRAQKTKTDIKDKKKQPVPNQTVSPPQDLDVSNMTIRKSMRNLPSSSSTDSNGSNGGKKGRQKEKVTIARRSTRSSVGSNRSSTGSRSSVLDNSNDDTTLHTIVYEKEFEQGVLDDSSELQDTRRSSRGSITIPETPDGSEESEPEPEPAPKGKRRGKK